METTRFTCSNCHYYRYRGIFKKEIVEDHNPKWYRWWLFYYTANNPNYNQTLPTAS